MIFHWLKIISHYDKGINEIRISKKLSDETLCIVIFQL